MARDIDLIEPGDRVRFTDRWQGYIAGFDVSPQMELLNVVVNSGILMFKQSVKLPGTALKDWSDSWVDIDANSFAAFNREVPPVAVPGSPLSRESNVSQAGARLAGLMVRHRDRHVIELLISRGGKRYRISAADVAIEGNSITLGKQFESLPEYYSDAHLESGLRDAIAEDAHLTADDKRSVSIDVESGIAIIGGNVRVEDGRERVQAIVTAQKGLLGVRDESVDDITLETTIGMALSKAGLQRRAEVYARSNLGRVTLYGSATSPQLNDDVTREIARIPGVREVTSKLLAVPA
jgi:osmotically-inducible protein OsmY